MLAALGRDQLLQLGLSAIQLRNGIVAVVARSSAPYTCQTRLAQSSALESTPGGQQQSPRNG
jgi:hypothetical protein